MRIMALDIGESNIGIAVSDKMNILAIPYSTEKNNDDFPSKLNNIILEKDIKRIVIGVPYNLNGKLGFQANKTLDFVEKLKKKINIEVHFADERFSTKISKENLSKIRKTGGLPVDKYAAAVILENYLDNIKFQNEKNEN